MILKINGQNKTFEDINYLSDIIDKFCKSNKNVIAEVNKTIIKSPNWGSTKLNDGDNIELVGFVGGG